MSKLRSAIEHITYRNPEYGWSVMKFKIKDYKKLVTLAGALLDVPVDSVLPCEGKRQGNVSVIQNQTRPNSNQAQRAS